MLDRNPKARIGFDEMLAHPVFANLEFNRVANLEYNRELIVITSRSIDVMILILYSSDVDFPRGKAL